MTTSPVRATDRPPWRRTALTAGAVATAAWAVVVVLVLRQSSATDAGGGLAGWTALLASLLTIQLLRRMWSHPGYAGTAQVVLGHRLALAFEGLVAVLILLGLLGSVGLALQTMLALTAIACFLATFVLALPRPAPAS